MSSSSTAASDADEITFPPSTASSAASGTTEESAEQGTVVSYAATDGDSDDGGDSFGNNGGDSYSNSYQDMGHNASAPSANDGNNNNDSSEGDGYRRTHGSCEYYPSVSNSSMCQVQRSCYDCLNFDITTEAFGCMVNTMGVCAQIAKYDEALDYRLGHAVNNVSAGNSSYGSSSGSGGDDGATIENAEYQFLASAATYCDQDDQQCQSCIENQFAAVIYNNSATGRSQFCYGENGCVCIAVCEARSRMTKPIDKSCYANTMSANDQDKDANYGSVFMIVGAMVMVVIVVFAIYRIRKRGESVSDDDGANNNNNSNNAGPVNRRTSDDDQSKLVITPDHDASPIAMAVAVPVERRSSSIGKGSILLNLFNWAAMREMLIQREQMQMEGIDASALPADTTGVDADGAPTKGDVQFLDVEPSAPDMDDEKPSAPAVPVVTVPTAPVVWTVRAMAGPASPSAPSAPDFNELDYDDDEQAMTAL